MGGIEPARTLLLAAMERGAASSPPTRRCSPSDGATLHGCRRRSAASTCTTRRSVAGAIPLLRPLRESLAGDNVSRVLGIVNGTTNFILTKMDETGADFADALAEAQALGYAEADPTADVEGHDAAAKAAILAGLAFHTRVTLDDVYCEGITAVTAADVAAARAMDHVIKLLAICERSDDGKGVGVRVHPAMVPRTHPLAGVRDAYNAVFVEAEAAGQLMFYGRGAGGAPTASAVLGDLVAVGRNRLSRRPRSGRERLRGPRRCARSARRSRATTSPSTSPTRRVSSPRWPRPFAAHDVQHRDAPAGRPRRRRRPRDRHPPRDRGRRWPRSSRSCARLDVVRAVASVMRVEGDRARLSGTSTADAPTSLARRHRGVPRPAAGRRRDAGRDPARGRHAAGPAPVTSPSSPAARSTSRSRAPTRPAPSRTAA